MQGHYGIALAVTGIPGGLHAEVRQVQDGQPQVSEIQPHVYVLHVEERNVSRCRHQFPGNRQRTSVSGARTIVGILVVRVRGIRCVPALGSFSREGGDGGEGVGAGGSGGWGGRNG